MSVWYSSRANQFMIKDGCNFTQVSKAGTETVFEITGAPFLWEKFLNNLGWVYIGEFE